jgi:bacillithiol biosynthesis cysteine-adding enzyme BshC
MPHLDAVPTSDATTPPAWSVRSVPLGGSALSRALQDDPSLAGWLPARPGSAEAWTERLRRLRDQAVERDWLTPLAPAIAATGRAAERLGRAAASGVVLTTGQQPGLFGGPAYTWSKALSALAMADVLEEMSGMPVAPVFWAATDDADWVEASMTAFATRRGLEVARLEGPATDGIAMAEVPLGPVNVALGALASACGSAAHSSLLELVSNAYVPHATVGAAYVQLLRALLEPLGIAVLDAAHPAFRAAADPFLRRALQRTGAVAEALSARSAAIEAAGFTPQVDVRDGLSLVFRTTSTVVDGEPRRVRARVPIAEAAQVLREADPGSLGSNVLLRPVIERALLPTVAYHAGPGEYAYFAQVDPIAHALGLESPLAVPRWSGEVLDTRALARRDALGLDDSMLHGEHTAASRVAREAVDPEIQDALERLRVAIETQVRAVRDAVSRTEPVVAGEVVAGLASDLGARLERFERRVVAGVKRREAALMRDVAFVRASLRPDGQSPERVLNLLPMLARFGSSIFDAMRHEARAHAERLVHGR